MVPRFTTVVGRQWASDFAQVKAASGRFTLLPRSFHQFCSMAKLLLSAGQLFPVARQLLPVTRQLWRWRNGERFGPNGERFSENGDRFLACTADTRTRTAKPALATAVSLRLQLIRERIQLSPAWKQSDSKVKRPRARSTRANLIYKGVARR